MSFNKNQKSYNKQVMQTGKEANRYLSNALGLINKYTTNYADRTDFWTNKLNDRQLNLLSDKYLAQNAAMLRGQAAFGSNAALNRQMQENAYSQQNYLANVANQNVQLGNQLQQNELASLMNASTTYQTPIKMGEQAASNVDAANMGLFSTIGKGLQAAGAVSSLIPGGQVIGGALSGLGGVMSGLATPTTSYTPEQQKYYQDMFAQSAAAYNQYGGLVPKQGLSIRDKAQSTLSTQDNR